MKGDYIAIYCSLMLGSVVLGCTNGQTSGRVQDVPPDTVLVSVERVDGEFTIGNRPLWRVVDEEDPDSSGTTVHRGDIIYFYADSTDLELQFPMNYNSKFQDLDPELKNDHYRKHVAAGDTLKLKVKPNAPYGDVEYAVLVIKDCVMAIGDSVPTIKIDQRKAEQ